MEKQIIGEQVMDKHTHTLRVAQVLAGAPIGGAENFYTRLVCALNATKKIEQSAFTRKNAQREASFKQAGVPVSLHRFGGALDLLGHYQYRKALQQWQADIVLTYMNRATLVTPKGNYQLVARLGHYYHLKYYRHCDYWVGISKGICDHMVRGGLSAKNIVHIPNFVDEDVVEPLARNSFATPATQAIILAAGRLHTNKGFDTLLHAVANITDATLWLAGSGPEKANLKKLAERLKITERVRFLGWRTDINALMRTADLFVCPSRHEGLGSIVAESWFNECPIIATRSQGPSELIAHEHTGLLVDIDDIGALQHTIQSTLENPSVSARLTQNGLTEYTQKYNQKKITEMYLSFFTDIA